MVWYPRGTSQCYRACSFIWFGDKAPRVIGAHAYSVTSRWDNHLIVECCRDLPSSSIGVTGKPAHCVYISTDFISLTFFSTASGVIVNVT